MSWLIKRCQNNVLLDCSLCILNGKTKSNWTWKRDWSWHMPSVFFKRFWAHVAFRNCNSATQDLKNWKATKSNLWMSDCCFCLRNNWQIIKSPRFRDFKCVTLGVSLLIWVCHLHLLLADIKGTSFLQSTTQNLVLARKWTWHLQRQINHKQRTKCNKDNTPEQSFLLWRFNNEMDVFLHKWETCDCHNALVLLQICRFHSTRLTSHEQEWLHVRTFHHHHILLLPQVRRNVQQHNGTHRGTSAVCLHQMFWIRSCILFLWDADQFQGWNLCHNSNSWVESCVKSHVCQTHWTWHICEETKETMNRSKQRRSWTSLCRWKRPGIWWHGSRQKGKKQEQCFCRISATWRKLRMAWWCHLHRWQWQTVGKTQQNAWANAESLLCKIWQRKTCEGNLWQIWSTWCRRMETRRQKKGHSWVTNHRDNISLDRASGQRSVGAWQMTIHNHWCQTCLMTSIITFGRTPKNVFFPMNIVTHSPRMFPSKSDLEFTWRGGVECNPHAHWDLCLWRIQCGANPLQQFATVAQCWQILWGAPN